MINDAPISINPEFFVGIESQNAMQEMAQWSWQQDAIVLYGKQHAIPRQHLWLSANQQAYRYSGVSLQSAGWPDWVARLAHQLSQAFAQEFNCALANHYRNGQDKMGWHSDDEPELGKNPAIAIVSFGAERYLGLRKKGSTKMHSKVLLKHGSALYMAPDMQNDWQHALLAQSVSKVPDARFSLTFRHIPSC